MTKQSLSILNYLKEHNAVTAQEVADALGLEKRRVDSCFSAAIVNAGLGVRNTSISPSLLVLNEDGLAYVEEEV